ncbi:hypothetical protein HanPSC8_Chr01g0042081 [Helianthus annuus]|nr:hypothetical protein HanPSC8_Chr01g0042081 [Helianthus annuus]
MESYSGSGGVPSTMTILYVAILYSPTLILHLPPPFIFQNPHDPTVYLRLYLHRRFTCFLHLYSSCKLAEATLIAPVVNYWWPCLPSNLSQQAFSKQFLQDQWCLRVAHHSPSLTYWWNMQKWFPSLTVIAHGPDILSRQDRKLKRIFTAGRAGVEEQVRQQGEYETKGYGGRPLPVPARRRRPTPPSSLASRLRRLLQDGGDGLCDWLTFDC